MSKKRSCAPTIVAPMGQLHLVKGLELPAPAVSGPRPGLSFPPSGTSPSATGQTGLWPWGCKKETRFPARCTGQRPAAPDGRRTAGPSQPPNGRRTPGNGDLPRPPCSGYEGFAGPPPDPQCRWRDTSHEARWAPPGGNVQKHPDAPLLAQLHHPVHPPGEGVNALLRLKAVPAQVAQPDHGKSPFGPSCPGPEPSAPGASRAGVIVGSNIKCVLPHGFHKKTPPYLLSPHAPSRFRPAGTSKGPGRFHGITIPKAHSL